MGEKIKVLSEISIGNNNLEIELNKATFHGGPRYIHLQNGVFRLNFTESEFIQVVTIMNKAAKKLKALKKIEE